MIRKFINREKELAFLREKHKENGPQLIVIYGRRRVGKTELLLEFAKNHPHIYFLADKRGTEINAKRFAKIASDYFSDFPPEVSNFDEVFRYLIKKAKSPKNFIVIIDEFSYLVEKDSSIPSVFQLVFDEILKNQKIFLVLCGSSLSMMYKGVLSYKSPLYGRRTGDWELTLLKFKDVLKFFPNVSIKQAIEFFSVLGNIPAYLKEFSAKTSLWENIKKKILTKGSVLFREPEILLREELREPASYLSILEAMTKHPKLSEIASAAYFPAKDLPKYLNVLQKQMKIVDRKIPVTEKRSKKALYYIKDWFFNFWFKFVFPNLSLLEEGKVNEVVETIKNKFNIHVGFAFEEICREAAQNLFPALKIGSWWGAYRDQEGTRKSLEIDLVGLDDKNEEILLGECKWSEKVNAQRLLDELKFKASFLIEAKQKKIKYILFAKSFINQTSEAIIIDLNKISKVFSKKRFHLPFLSSTSPN